jgi:predicted ATPase
LVFTDIEGSTRLLAELGSDYADTLSEHRRMIRDAFRAYGGVEVDMQGDAFFYAFPDAGGAVAAAADAQQALSSGPIRVRIGIHTGEPLRTEEGYVGLDVHAGARVAACAHGGQVVVTKRTRDLASGSLRFRDLGEHRLKDLEEAVCLYQLGDELFPPLKSLSNTNLPIPVSSFLGRGAELAEAQALLDCTRLLTISGPGGTGKTRFSIELASRQVDDFPNGVFWVPLAALRDANLVTEEAGRVLGAKDGLATHIGEKRMLVLLDNFEQVVDAAPALGDLLGACRNLHLLVTSRETLRIDGETELPLPPLIEEESVALFCSRARAEPSELVSELCRRLDGLPLAIELAAARAKVLAPEELLPRLTKRLDVLRSGRDAESRHATLRTTIAWSYELLGPEEKQLFARLGIFAGGCTLGAAEEICEADVDTLQALLDKSLFRRAGDRYWMLETIREFALERHGERSDAVETLRRRNDYYVRLAEEAYRHREGSSQGKWLELLDPEHDNLRAAIAHAREVRDGELELRLALAVAPFRVRRGLFSEVLSDLERALVFSGRPDLRAQAMHLAGWTASIFGRASDAEHFLRDGLALARELGDPQLVVQMLYTLAGMVSDRDEVEAQLLYDELLELIERHPDERFPGAFVNLADFALRRRDYESARVFSARGIEVAREVDDPWPLSLALSNHGEALLELGSAHEAIEDFREALGVMQDAQDTHGMAMMVSSIGVAAVEVGKLECGIRLLAWAAAQIEELEADFTGYEGALHDQAVAKARQMCDRFDAEWDRGRAFSRDEALAEVAKTSV